LKVSSGLGAGIVLALCLFNGSPIYAQALNQELEGLLKTNPEILARRKEVEAARKGVDIAISGFLPKLDAVGEIGPEHIESPITERAQQDWNNVKQIGGVRMTQNIFDGFETPSEVKTARLNLEVAEFTYAGARQNVLFEGVDAYVEVLRQMRLVELAGLTENTIKTQLNLEDERVERGAGIAVDVLQAKSRLQVAKEQRVAFEGALKDGISRYIQIFNHPPDLSAMNTPVPPTDLLPQDLDEATKIALEENPAVNSSLATVAVAKERRRLTQADYYPTIDVVAAANVEKDNDLVEGTRTDYSIVLQATWNLFNGFATRSSVAQAAIDYRASLDNHESVNRQVVDATRRAWHELMTARERVALLENGVNIASEVFVARRRLREAGKETVINVLDAENEVNRARINLTIASSDSIVATYRVLQGMGRLDVKHLMLRTD
jgi:adhesin transport system outer membrane protein